MWNKGEYWMKILIIGNGFDLAHRLPTSYVDFLNYCGDGSCVEKISENAETRKEFRALTQNNLWMNYFVWALGRQSGTWIDLENKIKSVVEAFENITVDEVESKSGFHRHLVYRGGRLPDNKFIQFFNRQLEPLGLAEITQDDTGIHVEGESSFDLVKFLYDQLKRFVRSFEMYCAYVINKKTQGIQGRITEEKIKAMSNKESEIAYRVFPPELPIHQELSMKGAECKKRLVMAKHTFERDRCDRNAQLNDSSITAYKRLLSSPNSYLPCSVFDCVLSFNYTATYELLYGNSRTGYCYIHGKAQEDANVTNLVLGIDDGLQKGDESQNFEWVKFKKYFQRIWFKTGSDYKDWIKQIDEESEEIHEVYIVGHSLDKTDHDVLREFLTCANARATIYYYTPDDHIEKIERTIEILADKGKLNGKEELIRRVHGSDWRIRFVDQHGSEGLFTPRT